MGLELVLRWRGGELPCWKGHGVEIAWSVWSSVAEGEQSLAQMDIYC